MLKLRRIKIHTLIIALCCLTSSAAFADSVKHFKGKEAKDYAQALQLLEKYNGELATILNQETIAPADLGKIHKITYTLENSLATMKKDITRIADKLEELHKASEKTDINVAKNLGNTYVEMSNELVPSHAQN